MKRLQGKAYHNKKESLEIYAYSESPNNRICIYLKDAQENEYCHWLNDDESKSFDKTKYPEREPVYAD